MSNNGISPERAREALEEHPGASGWYRKYFESVVNGTMHEYYLSRLLNYRTNYSDDLPEVDVRELAGISSDGSSFTNDNYKCRGNVIMGIGLDLSGAVKRGVLEGEHILKAVEEFKKHDFRFNHGEFTTRDEINLINRTLDSAISYIAEKYYL